MAAPMLRLLTDCVECSKDLPSQPIRLGVGEDSFELRVEDIGKAVVSCLDDHLHGSVLEPDVVFERMEEQD